MRRSPKDTLESARLIGRRGLMLGGLQAAMVVTLALRMRSLQLEQADEFRLLADGNSVKIRLLPPARGLIHDRGGVLLAGNEQNYRVTITREDAGDAEAVLDRLRRLIAISDEAAEDIRQELRRRSPTSPITVADRLSWEEFARIAVNAPALPGVTPEVGLSRHYPLGADLAHVLGYVGAVSDYDLSKLENPDPLLRIPKFQLGKTGVEAKMEDVLRGKAGTRRVEVNSTGREMRELSRQEGIAGTDLQLTIDHRLQNYALARLGAESAAAVVIEVQTGEIVAISSAPSFDPNLFVRGISIRDYRSLQENDHRPLADKTVQGLYPPGSTFKVVTALAALEAGVIKPEETVYCPGHLDIGGRKFHCWKRGGHGRVNLMQSLEQSCDVYYYDVAQRVGIDKIADMARRLGIGVRHDLPLSAVAEGVAPDKAWKTSRYGQDWRIGDTLNASIGQGYVLASPLQLAVMTARIAAGRAIAPRLVRSVNGVEMAAPEAPSLGINPAHLDFVRRGMDQVVNSARGTAKSSRVVAAEMRMAGKTGTSQVRNITAAERARGVISNDDLPWERRDHALFVAYAPVEAPRYAISLVVEHGGGGSAAAAPIARDILLFALYGGLPPLAAYPESQRGRISSQHKAMDLIVPAPAADPSTGKTRA
ncbi:penicillin-binding protein 2 [Rhodobacter veldkampii DSM 11550]|uniref:Beta-lactamase n=1 Tax=Phaeovulum veldkampii DSM 11550 TaxID=1185920 RepID=A0A2T4JKI4_9RHOB|nr:penicillin-binding protein 2 [Phaeovulum veldkampii]MBK5946730.1 penicillin-binding protein 2 [Phaeovulum veldkampii DSM 11550]PTE18394.1 penicillin-binding protein 2 [Phaeovulum veldkampii DSM 11550]TDQ59271.1 peptidoglycan glycosyltransferase [Phaeovulum veldkampii DSM 11550]